MNQWFCARGMGAKARTAALGRLGVADDGASLLVVATGSYIGESFDCPLLDTLFLPRRLRSKAVSFNALIAFFVPTR